MAEKKLPSTDLYYCRKCTKHLPAKSFYEATDAGLIDTNLLQSVCKNCMQKLYDQFYDETKSMEKALHKMCTTFNIKFSNEAVSATLAHINTLLESGKNVNAVFGIYKMKILATQKSMDKSGNVDMTYEDVGTIFVDSEIDINEIPIPKEVMDFWGENTEREDIKFLENEYKNFKNTHSSITYAEKTLLKRVCYTLLDIKEARQNSDSTEKLVKELQELMKNLAISPNAAKEAAGDDSDQTFGLWVQEIEKEEPAQWLKSDSRYDLYADVGNTEEYFRKYILRPLQNFVMESRNFNVEDTENEDADLLTEEEIKDFNLAEEEE